MSEEKIEAQVRLIEKIVGVKKGRYSFGIDDDDGDGYQEDFTSYAIFDSGENEEGEEEEVKHRPGDWDCRCRGCAPWAYVDGLNGDPIMGFSLAQMVNCCGMDVFTHPHFEGLSYDDKSDKVELYKCLLRIAALQSAERGYGYLVNTDRLDNKPLMKALKALRWKELAAWTNPRHASSLRMYGKKLN